MNRPKILDRVLEAGALLAMILFICTVTLQVFARLALPHSPSWTEELSRYLFIYMIVFAAGLGIRDRGYAVVDTLHEYLPKNIKRVLVIAIDLALLGFLLVVAYKGIAFMKLGAIQTSPTLRIPMSLPQASITILATGVCVYLVLQIIQTIKGSSEGGGQ